METGVQKTVMDMDGRMIDGCYSCDCCENTGYSWICCKTGEKLEGFDSQEDKRNDNKERFLRRNIMIGVGHKCPLCTVTDKRTEIKFDADLRTIAEFVRDETSDVYINEDGIDQGKLVIGVTWIEGGWEDDDVHRDWVQEELSEVVEAIEEKFICKMTTEEEMEEERVIITL